jgi:hypothetical protein
MLTPRSKHGARSMALEASIARSMALTPARAGWRWLRWLLPAAAGHRRRPPTAAGCGAHAAHVGLAGGFAARLVDHKTHSCLHPNDFPTSRHKAATAANITIILAATDYAGPAPLPDTRQAQTAVDTAAAA